MDFVCVKCKKNFKQGEWDCFPGERHAVEQKVYHISNTCADVTDRAKSHVRVYVTSDREMKDANGTTTFIPARFVEFVGGVYETCDPEEQFFFETKYTKHLISASEWEKMYINPKELQMRKERELEARASRIEKLENDLLEREKKLRKAGA